jgi:hypothetical protein
MLKTGRRAQLREDRAVHAALRALAVLERLDDSTTGTRCRHRASTPPPLSGRRRSVAERHTFMPPYVAAAVLALVRLRS